MDNLYTGIGNRIREVRKLRGLKQTELANLLDKSLRTIQKYENGEIEISITMINELAKKLDTTPTYLLGYNPNNIRIESIADFCRFFFLLEQKTDIKFDFDIKKPKTDGIWKCSLSFDGQNANVDHNSTICMFLEEYESYREKFETYFISDESYEDWKKRSLAYYASSGLSDKETKEIDEATRLKRRNAIVEEQTK